MPPFSDDAALRREYATADHLRTRQSIHDRYSVPKVDFPAWVVQRVQWRGDEQVLDLGSGWGSYHGAVLPRIPRGGYTAADLSEGMLQRHPASRRIAARAEQLPFAAGCFDVVLANHMLYLVPDIPAALAECKRVLKPGGTLVAATNSLEHMPEFTALFRRAMMLLSPPASIYVTPPKPEHLNFALENGTRLLAEHFFAVVRHDLPGALVFRDVEPALAYLESLRASREAQLPGGLKWDEIMTLMQEQMSRVLKHFGELVVNKISGVLIASDRGDFIRDYVHHREDGMG